MKNLNLIVLLTIAASSLFAGNFTPGNLVVVRVGNGTDTLKNASEYVFLDEYSITGVLVQSIPLPTAVNGNNHSLTLTGSSTSEGALTLSPDGGFLSLAGYDTAPGYPVVADSNLNRTIARIGADGVPNTSTGFFAGSVYKKSNIRGAVSNDGNEFWCSGTSSASTGGTYYLPFGSFTSSPVHVSTATTNTRVVNIFGGQLYTSSGSSLYTGVNLVGAGLPVTSGQPTTPLPIIPPVDTSTSPYAYYFFDLNPDVPGNDVLYVCDDHTTGPGGGIYKYSLVDSVWVSNGNVASTAGIRGITGYPSCGGAVLFVSSQDGIYSLRDTTGYNQPITASYTALAYAGANTVFRGVAFAPGTAVPTAFMDSIASTKNVACNGQSNGAISLGVSGGISPYAYMWSDNDTLQNRTALPSGNYAVTVTDALGCSASASASLTEPSAIVVSSSVTNLPCAATFIDTGAINLIVTGGVSPYTFLWSNTDTTQNINGLDTGTYTVVITDSTNCFVVYNATVSNTGNLLINPVATNVSCHGLNNGAITTAPGGGSPGYAFAWSNDSTTQNISNLSPGDYSITVTDTLGCSIVNTIDITQPAVLTFSTNATEVACYGGNNGTASITVQGGTSPYTYAWLNSSDSSSTGPVAAGSYTVIVSDQHSCSLTASVTVNQPDSLTIQGTVTNATAYGASDGSIALSVYGGTPSYSYSWGNSDITPTISNLTANTYCVTVSDQNLCSKPACFTVQQPPSGIVQIGMVEKFIAYQAGANLLINAWFAADMQYSINFYDITGRAIFKSTPQTGSQLAMEIPVEPFLPGYYLVQLATTQGSISKKVIIVK